MTVLSHRDQQDKKDRANKTHSFRANVGRLFYDNSLAQVISVLAAPVLARLFSPESFGVATLLVAIATVVAAVGTLRYEQAIVLPEKKEEAEVLFRLSFGFLVLATMLSAAVITVLSVFNLNEITAWMSGQHALIYTIPVLALLAGMERILRSWQQREREFRCIGRAGVVNSLSTPLSRVVYAVTIGPTSFGLIAGIFLGYIFEFFVLLKDVPRGVIRRLILEYKTRRSHEVAKCYREFSLFATATELLNSISVQLPIFMLAIMYSSSIVGFYALAMRLLTIPLQALGEAVRQVYYQKASDLKNKKQDLVSPLVKSSIALFLIGLLPFGVLYIWGEQIFAMVLGDSWITAGKYAAILSPWLYSGLLLVPAQSTLTTLRKQALLFKFQSYLFLLRVSVFLYGFMAQMAVEDLLNLFSIGSASFNILTILIAFRVISVNYRVVLEKESTRRSRWWT